MVNKVITLTESELVNLIKRMVGNSNIIEEETTMDDSCLKKMGFKFYPKSKSMSVRPGPYGNLPSYYEGKYGEYPAIFYVDGNMRVLGGNFKEKNGKWKCASGKLNVFNLSEWKQKTPM